MDCGLSMNDFLASRRQWLVGAASLTTGILVSQTQRAFGDTKQGSTSPISLTVDPSKTLFRVRVELDVEGNVNVPRNALVSKEKASQHPLKAKSVLDWEERIIGFESDRTVAAAERFFYEAEGEGKSGNSSRKLELRKESQYVLVRRIDDRWLTYSPDTYLSGAELELLELPASSLAMDGMLPQVPVAPGDTYKPEKAILAKLLSLASVEDSDVVGEVDSIDDVAAKLHFKGKVQGSVAGVPTTIDLVGKMVFDRQTMSTSWLALAVREQREIGKSEPGFEVAATIKMIRKPLDVPARLSSIPPSTPDGAVDNERLYCELTSTAVGYTALMDRRWKMMSDAAGASMMRMIENDRGIGQCDLRPAGKMAAGTQLTMAALVADIKQSLGSRFGQLLESREEVNEFGLRVLKVATQGAVEGVPVQWIFMHFSDDTGRRLLATMTVGGSDLDAFAGADVQLASSLRFIPTEEESTDVAKQPAKATIK
jgi:hypothetical protein